MGGMMSEDKTRDPQAEVISANVDFYRDIARKYDEYETFTRNQYLQQMFRSDIEQMRGLLQGHVDTVRCLDCGGGSGNISLKLLEMGWDVTVIDVSPDMLNLLEAKARTKGFRPNLVNSSIEAFLTATNDKYDVITFNSVLHHLYSYLDVIDHVLSRIRPEGLFYSNFDPVIPRNPVLPMILESLDTTLAKAFHDPYDFFPGTVRRIKKVFHASNETHQRAILSSGDLAEYHAKTGVDDRKIIALLQAREFSIIDHRRWTGGRTWFVRYINQHLRTMETFKVLARRSSSSI
jgi:2-polyprenyl-3-methyl-5-hydroxy-6-metoxy-1,4-benzoquinol methylase